MRVKAVILGQDPYHGPGQAHGMCFSVKKGVALPPSLKNIFRELESDMGCTVPPHGCLTQWAEQGVLLLNTVLTVREGQANSHKGQGWEIFTDTVIRHLNRREKPIVFLLWEECKGEVLSDHEPSAPHPDGSASESAVSPQRLFRLRSFFQNR